VYLIMCKGIKIWFGRQAYRNCTDVDMVGRLCCEGWPSFSSSVVVQMIMARSADANGP
jgi:hypothetical protein